MFQGSILLCSCTAHLHNNSLHLKLHIQYICLHYEKVDLKSLRIAVSLVALHSGQGRNGKQGKKITVCMVYNISMAFPLKL